MFREGRNDRGFEEKMAEMPQTAAVPVMGSQHIRKYLSRRIEVLDKFTPVKVKECHGAFNTNVTGSSRITVSKDVF